MLVWRTEFGRGVFFGGKLNKPCGYWFCQKWLLIISKRPKKSSEWCYFNLTPPTDHGTILRRSPLRCALFLRACTFLREGEIVEVCADQTWLYWWFFLTLRNISFETWCIPLFLEYILVRKKSKTIFFAEWSQNWKGRQGIVLFGGIGIIIKILPTLTTFQTYVKQYYIHRWKRDYWQCGCTPKR